MARIEKMPTELAGYVALRKNHEMVHVGKILVWTFQSDGSFKILCDMIVSLAKVALDFLRADPGNIFPAMSDSRSISTPDTPGLFDSTRGRCIRIQHSLCCSPVLKRISGVPCTTVCVAMFWHRGGATLM